MPLDHVVQLRLRWNAGIREWRKLVLVFQLIGYAPLFDQDVAEFARLGANIGECLIVCGEEFFTSFARLVSTSVRNVMTLIEYSGYFVSSTIMRRALQQRERRERVGQRRAATWFWLDELQTRRNRRDARRLDVGGG